MPPANPTAVGQVAVPVRDVERATAFYRDVLGLDFLFSAPPGLAFFGCGEVRLMLSRPEGESGGSPLLYYRVEGLDETHRRMVEAGAEVAHEPQLVHTTGEVELHMAFYRDGEGNTFGLMEER